MFQHTSSSPHYVSRHSNTSILCYRLIKMDVFDFFFFFSHLRVQIPPLNLRSQVEFLVPPWVYPNLPKKQTELDYKILTRIFPGFTRVIASKSVVIMQNFTWLMCASAAHGMNESLSFDINYNNLSIFLEYKWLVQHFHYFNKTYLGTILCPTSHHISLNAAGSYHHETIFDHSL